MHKYVLLEGIPGAGKSTLIKKLYKMAIKFNLVPDIGNPATLEKDFQMDKEWILEIECLKSQLAQRAKGFLVIQERGYLSVLACHYVFKDGSFKDIVRRFSEKKHKTFFDSRI